MIKLLVDGDIVVYRCGFAAEHNVYLYRDFRFDSYRDWMDYAKTNELDVADMEEVEVIREVEDVSHALANVKSVMSTINDKFVPNELFVFLSQGECFRNDIATIMEYKGNRRDAPKPVHYEAIREYLTKHYGAITVNSIEADDALALCQTWDTSCIVSIDKDLLQVPGKHYNWVKEEATITPPEVGTLKKYVQVLTGDSTDNIPGIYGVGPKTARSIILEPNTADEEFLLAVCTDHWRDYLCSDKPKPFVNLEFVDDDLWQYEHWSGCAVIKKSTREIVQEVLDLVTVGGTHAKQALKESGEEIPLPGEAERKEPAAA